MRGVASRRRSMTSADLTGATDLCQNLPSRDGPKPSSWSNRHSGTGYLFGKVG